MCWGGIFKPLSKWYHLKHLAQQVGRLTAAHKAEVRPLEEAQGTTAPYLGLEQGRLKWVSRETLCLLKCPGLDRTHNCCSRDCLSVHFLSDSGNRTGQVIGLQQL